MCVCFYIYSLYIYIYIIVLTYEIMFILCVRPSCFFKNMFLLRSCLFIFLFILEDGKNVVIFLK